MLNTVRAPKVSYMLRQLFTAAAPSARLASPLSTTLKTQLTHQPTWRLSSSTTTFPRVRLFTTTHTTQDSPFRLSTDKSSTPFPEDDPYSAYPPKRQWPPDMRKLSPKHQFRLERKYRRRAALKYARPKFIKMVTLAQWIIIGFVAVYAVLFMNWDTKDTPFDGIRENFFSGLKAIFSAPPPPASVRKPEEKN